MRADTKKILVVDDEPSITRLMKLNLEQTGEYIVRAETSSTAALHAALEFQPDLIFLDVVMPDMEGGELAQVLRESPKLRTVPIVFLTAVITPDEIEKSKGMIGGDEFLSKPVEMEKVFNCLRSHFPITPPIAQRDASMYASQFGQLQ